MWRIGSNPRKRGTAADHNNLGLLVQRLGDLEEARRQFDTALALNRRDGRDDVAATNLVNLAGLASLAGEFTRAEALYRDALATWRAHESWADAAVALHGLGQLELRRGDYPAARMALREALGIYARTGPIAEELGVRRDLAGALAAAGDLQGARDELSRAQRRADSTRAPPGARAGIALARADLAFELNTLAEARSSGVLRAARHSGRHISCVIRGVWPKRSSSSATLQSVFSPHCIQRQLRLIQLTVAAPPRARASSTASDTSDGSSPSGVAAAAAARLRRSSNS